MTTSTKWPDTVELTIDSMAQGGEGVGRWEGRVVFAGGGLPGEQVRVALTERHESYARGEVKNVLKAAPERIEPRVPGADQMPWQHIAYRAQLRFKRQILAEQLSKIGGLGDLPVDETVPAAQPWNYRSSARLHIEGGVLGYHIAGTREVRPFTDDPLLQPVLNRALKELRDVLNVRSRASEVLVRASEAHGYVVAELRGGGDLGPLVKRWRNAFPPLAGVVLPDGEAVGSARLHEEVGGVVFSLQPGSFFQVNVAAAEALLGLVREGLELRGGERLLDLYCGVGTFTLPLAAGGAAEVFGVEEFPGAVADAEESARANSIANVQFLEGRVEQMLARLSGPFDAAVLDPPRRGCHPRAVEELLRLRPARIVYVSCQPATLSRDLKMLVEGGYTPLRARPVDLFPQTAHIESVITLARA
ncbi:MAG TPA: 23S rRNA (uracil(1939)-C(5))-methyltransferase RlmD [Roseiflexaceae bacterium]|nr:23S rRNA (uracil(1939)-C(5))-methyltransferase RlmD [Roseiflexaceae bacterium]